MFNKFVKTTLEYFSNHSDLIELHIRCFGCSVSVLRRSSDGESVSAIGFGAVGDNEIYDEYGKAIKSNRNVKV